MRRLALALLDARPHLILLAIAVHLAGTLLPDEPPTRTAGIPEPLTMNVDWTWDILP